MILIWLKIYVIDSCVYNVFGNDKSILPQQLCVNCNKSAGEVTSIIKFFVRIKVTHDHFS